MKILKRIAVSLSFTLAVLHGGLKSGGQSVSHDTPDLFSIYSVRPTFQGRFVRPILTNPEARHFRTRIREAIAEGVTFADHYAVAVWGCGGGCTSFAIIDAISGKVYVFPATVSQFREEGERLTYRRNSRAMHIIGSLNEYDSADRWYVWNGKKLDLVSEKPARLADDH